MNIKGIAFEEGYITITPEFGTPFRMPIAVLLGGTLAPLDLAILEGQGGSVVAADLALLAGLVAASKGIVKVYEETIDCSGGGTAETQALVTLPAGSLILEVTTWCNVAFDGDTTKTFEIGVAGNTDKYTDPSDCPVTLNGIMSMAGGTNNDQKVPEMVAASTALIATWTNTANMTVGSMKVRVVYY